MRSESYSWNTEDPSERHERLAVVNALRHRTSQMAVLNRESIPMPLIPDIPKQLAIITSAVIRNSRDYHARAKPNDPSDRPLNEFCSRCFEVEESALHRVSQLATRISSADRRRAEHSPSMSISGSPTSHRKKRKSNGRPATAPSPSDPDHARRLFSEPTSPLSSTSHSQTSWAEASASRMRRHLKSSSTDSIPYPKPSATTPLATALDTPDSDDKKKKGLLRGIWRR